MAVTMSDISKLRKLTGAGMMDCKKALEETNCDMDAAVEIIRKKGQAVAAKREDREASEGCVLSAATADFCAIVALKCETDFVAKNEGFVALTKAILDAAVAAKAKSLDEVKELEVNGRKVADLIVEEIGKTGEKMELGAYECLEGAGTTCYDHLGNKLSTIATFTKPVERQVGRNVAMQIASMNPVSVSRNDVCLRKSWRRNLRLHAIRLVRKASQRQCLTRLQKAVLTSSTKSLACSSRNSSWIRLSLLRNISRVLTLT